MPGFIKQKKRASHFKKESKMPTEEVTLVPAELKDPVDEKIQTYCDALMQSEWRQWSSRPETNTTVGFFAVMQYYVRQQTWVVLYIGNGIVRQELDQLFGGRSKEAIAHYMSSCQKRTKRGEGLVWLKWLHDPFYPYESLSLKDVIKTIGLRYNCGEIPAFNADQASLLPPDVLPDDFTIVPNWKNKSKNKKKAK